MAATRIRLTSDPGDDELHRTFDAIRAELEVPTDFPPEALAEAERVAREQRTTGTDLTDVPFVTIDPVGSMDLDQAMHLERDGQGVRVRYAIADVPLWVDPGGAVDAEARRRGQTVYAPDQRTPLHPTVLSEDAASLLPGVVRPAFVWDLRVDADGQVRLEGLDRAMVRSAARLDYDGVQRDLDDGRADELLLLLREVGLSRMAQERARGGASLPMPEQEVHPDPAGGYTLELRPLAPVEDWNAQISLMTGMAAASVMLEGGVGILRTMPPAAPRDLQRLRRQCATLGVPWPEDQPYGEMLQGLDRRDPRHLAVIHAATSLFRGASYTPFDGQPPEQTQHAALAADYAHVTAPLRRLVDRFGLAVCEALVAGQPVPDWARAALPDLPELMKASDRRAKGVERACTDAVEAAVLQPHVGEVFAAGVVEQGDKGPALVQLTGHPILAPCRGEVELGQQVQVRLVEASVAERRVTFEAVGPGANEQRTA
ncbi:RNB domain-containing ribonuclease [Arsenicicoccus sp. oral taxon 190]|uniref:RNB domain-containing ribonuclease n=1 Tax=Arsenicicoccus sp. oral taxon 190 TaxID=1658671 RepID=UPI00067A1336|nr:RNB domain-containing ribonuclease [Arsenicicoccus sp. oral taxon 190]AKT52878.1 ribonuclease II [Arsenicicoccus sp. oral taxon 190]